MLKVKMTHGIIIALCTLIVFGISLSIYFVASRDDRNIIDVKLDSSESQSSVEFCALGLVPGKSVEYTIRLTNEVEGEYNITLEFEEEAEQELKKYVFAKIEVGGKIICDSLLADLFNGEKLSFSGALSSDKSRNIKITYYMPDSVGNEAQNAEANFELRITASDSKKTDE